MFKQALVSLIFVLSAISFSNAYACQEDGCAGTVYGPVNIAGVHGIGSDMYIVAIIEDTAVTGNTLPSGADDPEACRYDANTRIILRPLETLDAAGSIQTKAMLDVLTTGQAASDTQTMLFLYTWSEALGACVMTTVGYMN